MADGLLCSLEGFLGDFHVDYEFIFCQIAFVTPYS